MGVRQAIYDRMTEEQRRAPGPLVAGLMRGDDGELITPKPISESEHEFHFDDGPGFPEPHDLPNVDDVVIRCEAVPAACGGMVLVGCDLVREKSL